MQVEPKRVQKLCYLKYSNVYFEVWSDENRSLGKPLPNQSSSICDCCEWESCDELCKWAVGPPITLRDGTDNATLSQEVTRVEMQRAGIPPA
jgi:hypothetical protein